MFKLAKILLILILISILIAAILRHNLCQHLIIKTAAGATGLELSIQDLDLDILNNSLYMRGITLFNPPGFKNKVLGKVKEIFIEYDSLDFLSGRLHLRQVKADIGEINIIRNEKGSSNLSVFRTKQSKSKASAPKASARDTSAVLAVQKKAKRTKKKRPKFLIDRLELSLEKATFVDYKAGIGESAVIIFTIKGPLVYKNVSDLSYVVSSVSAKGGFANLLSNFSGTNFRDILQTTTETIKNKIENILIRKSR